MNIDKSTALEHKFTLLLYNINNQTRYIIKSLLPISHRLMLKWLNQLFNGLIGFQTTNLSFYPLFISSFYNA